MLPFLFCSPPLRIPVDLNLSLCRLCYRILSYHYRNALLRSNVIRRTGIGNWCVKFKLVPVSWQGSLLLCSAHERSYLSTHVTIIQWYLLPSFEHKMFLMSQPLGYLRLFAKKYLTVMTLKLGQKWLVESI